MTKNGSPPGATDTIPPMGEEEMVTVHIAGDVAAGEMITELLRAEGIAAQLLSVSSALLGAAPHLFQTKVLVPAADVARAAEILRELETTAGETGALQAPAGESAPDALASSTADSPAVASSAADDGRAEGPTPRRPRVAAAFAFLFPGGGHLYAGATVTAIVVEAAIGACLLLLLRGRGRMFQQDAALATLVALAVSDSWGAVRLVRAHSEGRWSPPLARAIARGLVLVVLAVAAGSAVAALASIPRWNRERRLAPFSMHCGGTSSPSTTAPPVREPSPSAESRCSRCSPTSAAGTMSRSFAATSSCCQRARTVPPPSTFCRSSPSAAHPGKGRGPARTGA